jgi:argininosuccinate synthase
MSTQVMRSFYDMDAMRGQIDHVLTMLTADLNSSYILKNLAQRIFPSFAKVQS